MVRCVLAPRFPFRQTFRGNASHSADVVRNHRLATEVFAQSLQPRRDVHNVTQGGENTDLSMADLARPPMAAVASAELRHYSVDVVGIAAVVVTSVKPAVAAGTYNLTQPRASRPSTLSGFPVSGLVVRLVGWRESGTVKNVIGCLLGNHDRWRVQVASRDRWHD